MYGTVARMRMKAGKEEELKAMMEEWEKGRGRKVKGAIATYLYKLDKNPNELIMVVMFQDKKSYMANAEDPEQDKWYRRYRALLQADPEWNDGEIIAVEVNPENWTGG